MGQNRSSAVMQQRSEPNPTEFHWIAPCRESLELPGDYPDETTAQAEVAQSGGLPLSDA